MHVGVVASLPKGRQGQQGLHLFTLLLHETTRQSTEIRETSTREIARALGEIPQGVREETVQGGRSISTQVYNTKSNPQGAPRAPRLSQTNNKHETPRVHNRGVQEIHREPMGWRHDMGQPHIRGMAHRSHTRGSQLGPHKPRSRALLLPLLQHSATVEKREPQQAQVHSVWSPDCRLSRY